MNNKTFGRDYVLFLSVVSIGIIARFFVMSLGHNYDFESYCIVGEIAGNSRNVYAETSRYNYGFIFFCIQGFLYRIAQFAEVKSGDWILVYRILIVLVLTMADIGITCFIAWRYSMKKALLFFLNPISVIITGYHNQFDNIAIFLALLSILFYNEDEEFNRKDIFFVLLFSLSLIIKHILFLLPSFILLKKGLAIKKKVVYAFLPPMIFLMSFVPFALSSSEALNGIINNVFLYKSSNNAPLLILLYNFIGFNAGRFSIYVVFMLVMAIFLRKKKFEEQLLLYLIAMVAFSSAIANQYLVIPMAALCILETGIWKYLYVAEAGIYLFLHVHGLGALIYIQQIFPGFIGKMAGRYTNNGYIMAAWILLFSIIYLMRSPGKKWINKKVLE